MRNRYSDHEFYSMFQGDLPSPVPEGRSSYLAGYDWSTLLMQTGVKPVDPCPAEFKLCADSAKVRPQRAKEILEEQYSYADKLLTASGLQRGTRRWDGAALLVDRVISDVELVVGHGLKQRIDAARPYHYDATQRPAQGPDRGVLPGIMRPPHPSMPSGHSAGALAAALVLRDLQGPTIAFGTSELTSMNGGLNATNSPNGAQFVAPNVCGGLNGLFTAAWWIGVHRLIAGLHFWCEVKVGWTSGFLIYEAIGVSPRYRADLAAAQSISD